MQNKTVDEEGKKSTRTKEEAKEQKNVKKEEKKKDWAQ